MIPVKTGLSLNMQADMQIYLVGGAVRDQLLGLTFREKDWVVTGATPQQMLELGYRQKDPAFPVFLHPETSEEYALARRETKQGRGYKGFIVDAGPEVTLHEDLLRRDLTINAMAIDDSGNLIDPYNGMDDLQNGWLRHVSPAFVEDPFRLIRIARFAAKLGGHGFRVTHPTFKLMKSMATGDELASLSRERFVEEMLKSLEAPQPWQFFKLLGKCGALECLLPGLNHWVNGDEMKHGEDSPAISRLKLVCQSNQQPAVRLAVLLFDAIRQGRYDIAQQLPLPKPLQQLLTAVTKHARVLLASKNASQILLSLQSCGLNRQGTMLEDLLQVLRFCGDAGSDRDYFSLTEQLSHLKASDLSQDKAQDGLTGEALGKALIAAREAMVQQWLENN
jgi:tRNA nucleotidyltransferase (CCA-adding enzyme)